MSDYTNLRAIIMGDILKTSVDLAELSMVLAEVDQLRAAAPAKKTRAKKAAPAAGAAVLLPDWLPVDTWQAFLDMRKAIKKPATERAQVLLIKKLTAFYANDLDPGAILNQSIINNWQDLYAPKEASTAYRGAGRAPAAPVADQNRANSAEALRLLGQPMFGDDGMTIEAAQ